MRDAPTLQNLKDFQWLFGLIEAESSFYVFKRKLYGKERFYVTFSIPQPLNKTQLLHHLKRLFECGHIKTTSVMEDSRSKLWSPSVVFRSELIESSISTYNITNRTSLWTKDFLGSGRDLFVGLTEGGGTFIISLKSCAAPPKWNSQLILSFVLARTTLFQQLSGRFALIFNMKGSTYIWETSNKALVSLLHSLRTKKKVEFIKWCAPLSGSRTLGTKV
uniref:Homing endonuclease n=1 Tax=Tylopathes sp. n. NB-2020 TaxID=2733780 RepID=A0A6M4RGY3_9CNID|nr:homing endonuclease [Tylopathes sp. n. NB-2020]